MSGPLCAWGIHSWLEFHLLDPKSVAEHHQRICQRCLLTEHWTAARGWNQYILKEKVKGELARVPDDVLRTIVKHHFHSTKVLRLLIPTVFDPYVVGEFSHNLPQGYILPG